MLSRARLPAVTLQDIIYNFQHRVFGKDHKRILVIVLPIVDLHNRGADIGGGYVRISRPLINRKSIACRI